jgi:peroxiredoxin
MKQILFYLLALALVAGSCNSNVKKSDSYDLKGTIKGMQSGYIWLLKRENQKYTAVDSVKTENGTFSFKGKQPLAEMYTLKVEGIGSIDFFLENSAITVEASADSISAAKVKGSQSNDLYVDYQKGLKVFNDKLEQLYNIYQTADAQQKKWIEKQIDSTSTLEKNHVKKFIADNPQSVVAAYALLHELSYELDLKELTSLAGKLVPELANSVYVVELNEIIRTLQKVEIGMVAPDFSMPDITGKETKLSSLFGKYMLIDFWASWCHPCRAENPNVVKAYAKYKSKGFQIVGVSLDKDKTDWAKAISDDNLAWTQLSDLKGWDNSAARLYGIRSIPANFLLDPNGTIIAKNLRESDLIKKLDEIYNSPVKKKK